MLELVRTKQFRREYKKMLQRGKDKSKLETVLSKLMNEEPLEPKYRDHALNGNRQDERECHIEPDWLLIYKINNNELILTALRTGTHSDLF